MSRTAVDVIHAPCVEQIMRLRMELQAMRDARAEDAKLIGDLESRLVTAGAEIVRLTRALDDEYGTP